MEQRTCEIDGCGNHTRSPGSAMCETHYQRQYRHGSVHTTARTANISVSHGRRYKSRYLPEHPLAGANGKVYEHRQVLYDLIGPDSTVCYWCGQVVRWKSTRGDQDCLVVDHLNGLGDDNRPANLAPSCQGCNSGRGTQARAKALRSAGWWSSHDTIARLKTRGRRPLIEPG